MTGLDVSAFSTKHAKILDLWGEGRTSGDIAHELKLTRSAVMGVLFRARKRGLVEKRKTEDGPKEKRVTPKRERVKRLALPSVFACEPPPEVMVADEYVAPQNTELATPHEPVHILEARFGQCRWIVGKAADNLALFCGNKTVKGLSYCVTHRKLVYVPMSKAKVTTPPKKAYRF